MGEGARCHTNFCEKNQNPDSNLQMETIFSRHNVLRSFIFGSWSYVTPIRKGLLSTSNQIAHSI